MKMAIIMSTAAVQLILRSYGPAMIEFPIKHCFVQIISHSGESLDMFTRFALGGVCWLNPLDISGHFFHNIADPSKATSADGAPFQLYGAWYRMGQEESDYLFMCHSQGCNILMSQLESGCEDPECCQ